MQEAHELERGDGFDRQLMENLERNHNIDILQALFERGAITSMYRLQHYNDNMNGSRQTVLYWACRFNWNEGVAFIMLNGGDPFLSYPQGNTTPYDWVVHNYAQNDHFQGAYFMVLVNVSDRPVESVLDTIGRNPDAPLRDSVRPNPKGMTALMFAFKSNLKWGICWLLEGRKAQINVRDMDGRTAFEYLLERINEEWDCVEYRNLYGLGVPSSIAQDEVKLAWFLAKRFPDCIDPSVWSHKYGFAVGLIARNAHILNPGMEFELPANLTAMHPVGMHAFQKTRVLEETGRHHKRYWRIPFPAKHLPEEGDAPMDW